VEPSEHVLLSTRGVSKRYHADFDPVEAHALLEEVRGKARGLASRSTEDLPARYPA
jgi:hypothetical protein